MGLKMGYKTVEAYVDVEVDLDEWNDKELIDELNSRGYIVTKDADVVEAFEREDWQFLLEMLDKNPQTWYTRRVRDKLLEARFG
jgi:hypothetical protein